MPLTPPPDARTRRPTGARHTAADHTDRPPAGSSPARSDGTPSTPHPAAWTVYDTDAGHVIVQAQGPDPRATVSWDIPTDRAADRALSRIGWYRTGPWHPDWLGRGTAPVRRSRPSDDSSPQAIVITTA